MHFLNILCHILNFYIVQFCNLKDARLKFKKQIHFMKTVIYISCTMHSMDFTSKLRDQSD